MILEKGDMFQMLGGTDLFLVTTNAEIDAKNQLVMGKGAALQLKKRMPHIALALGQQLVWLDQAMQYYGLIINESDYGLIGGFQTKLFWSAPSYPYIIKLSCAKLFEWLLDHPSARVDFNFPGIGYGGLSREEVLPTISLLPNNVHIWEL